VRGLPLQATYRLFVQDPAGNVGEAAIDLRGPVTVELGPLEFTRRGSATGTVTDAAGRPLAGVVVQAQPEEGGPWRDFVFDWQGLTDRNGRYRIAGLPAGAVRLFVDERIGGGNRIAEGAATVVAGTAAPADLQAR
jgi:hypothetical protein